MGKLDLNVIEDSIEIQGQKLTLQFGKFAQAVDMSVFATLGGTAVLVTVATGPENPAIDYFPLSIEYNEKLYAGGIIKGSQWVKREGRASDEAVLIGRLIDRSIRPLFPKAYKRQVQVVVTLLSIDGVNSPDVLACIATSAAVHASTVPWDGPISTMRVGYVKTDAEEGSLVLNPKEDEQALSSLDLVVSSTTEKVLMIETKAEMIHHEIIEEGIEMAKVENAKVIQFINSLKAKVGKTKGAIPAETNFQAVYDLIETKYHDALTKAMKDAASSSSHENADEDTIIASMIEELNNEYDAKQLASAIEKWNYANIKKNILEKKARPDGRAFDQVRDLYIELNTLPRTHGSALFQRGQTQILSIVTLGSTSLEQKIEGPEGKAVKSYMHHYSDGPYSYGTVGKMFGPSRRAIGHGALAEKAIEPVLPTTQEFPYAIRVVSEILAENGSSSMGSATCSSLALMQAGVPVKAAVAGVAMGMVSKSDDEYAILTDIVGLEDFAGEMDFKIAGTYDGITAIQLDVKNQGLTKQMIHEIFTQGLAGRRTILDFMNQYISTANKHVSQYAPKVVLVTIPVDKIGEVIGPGGKNIKALIARSGCDINIDDAGNVSIAGVDMQVVQETAEYIRNTTRSIEVGEVFEGEVKRLLPFGAFVELVPGKEGMVHVSKMNKGFVRNPADVVSIGEIVKVRVYQIDNQGRINLEMLNSQD